MKILIATNHSYMLWQFRRELIAALLERGHQVMVSTPFVGHQKDLEGLGCRCVETAVDRRGVNLLRDLGLCMAYRRLLAAEDPDLVLTYSIKPNIYAGFLCRLRGVPYCANVQGLGTAFQSKGLAELVTLMYRVALKGARTVFFENQSNAALFRQRNVLNAARQTVLPGAGVNLERYGFRPCPDHGEQVRLLYLGRIMREKGVDELFWAVRRLRETYGGRVVLALVGFFEDEYREQVETLVQEGAAVFYGFQEDPRPFYADADCVVLPSYHEGMSNVLLEAAATGRPVVTSDIPGCREAVEDGTTGYLCRVMNREDLYHKLDAFVRLPLEERAEMGRRARAKMERDFDKQTVVDATLRGILGD